MVAGGAGAASTAGAGAGAGSSIVAASPPAAAPPIQSAGGSTDDGRRRDNRRRHSGSHTSSSECRCAGYEDVADRAGPDDRRSQDGGCGHAESGTDGRTASGDRCAGDETDTESDQAARHGTGSGTGGDTVCSRGGRKAVVDEQVSAVSLDGLEGVRDLAGKDTVDAIGDSMRVAPIRTESSSTSIGTIVGRLTVGTGAGAGAGAGVAISGLSLMAGPWIGAGLLS